MKKLQNAFWGKVPKAHPENEKEQIAPLTEMREKRGPNTMADMIFTNYVVGQRAVTVVCPNCGRISRLALKNPLVEPSSVSRQRLLYDTYVCPVCHAQYEYATIQGCERWSSAFGRYMQDEEGYNADVRKNYQARTQSPGTYNAQTVPPLSSAKIPMREEHTRPNAIVVPISRDSVKKPMDVSNPALAKKVEYWKKELLDTGKKNKMINYRETKRSTLRILDPSPTELFNRLAFSEKPLSFQKPIDKRSDIRTFSMLALLETLSYSLPAYKGDIKTAGTISERERTLKNLRSKAKLALEEQGTNILYLSFGFIVWRNGSEFMRSPLLMMPVTISQKSLNSPYLLTKNDDDIEVNPTLDYLFNSEFGIDLPTFDAKNKDSFEEYLKTIEDIVDKRGWRLVREVSLGLLSFLKISMYHDLNDHEALIEQHPVLQAMAGNEIALQEMPNELANYNYDEANPNDWFEVVDADSSQEEAILLSRLGVSFVLQGPPGTGKSQTITNIIADSLANRKKVLFVSEKAAALQVVLKRLKEVHLDDFCLSLHDYKANKKEIVHNIGANLELEPERASKGIVNDLVELKNDRVFLSEYAKELHEVISPLEESIYSVLGKLAKLDENESIPFVLNDVESVSDVDFANWLYLVGIYERALKNMEGELSANPWKGTTTKTYSVAFQREMVQKSEHLPEQLIKLDEKLSEVTTFSQYPFEHTWNGLQDSIKIIKRILTLPLFPYKWIEMRQDNHLLETAQRKSQLYQDVWLHYNRIRENLSQIEESWTPSLLQSGLSDIAQLSTADTQNETFSAFLMRRESTLHRAQDSVIALTTHYAEATSVLGLQQSDERPTITCVSSLLGLISNAPVMETLWFDIRKTEELMTSITDVAAHQNIIKQKKDKILEAWEPGVFDIDASGMLARFKTEYSGLFYKIKSTYKEDMKTAKLLSKEVKKNVSDTEVVSILQEVIALGEESKWFVDVSSKMISLFGESYKGINTDTTQIISSIQTAVKIANLFPYANVPASVIDVAKSASRDLQLGAEMRRLNDELSLERIFRCQACLNEAGYNETASENAALQNAVSWIEKQFVILSAQRSMLASLEPSKKDGIIREPDLQKLQALIEGIVEDSQWFETYHADSLNGMDGVDTVSSIASIMEKAQRISETVLANVDVGHVSELMDFFDSYYAGSETKWSLIIELLTQVKAFLMTDYQETQLPFIKLVCRDSVARGTIEKQLAEIESLQEQAKTGFDYFSGLFPYESMEEQQLNMVANKHSACLDDFVSLNKWIEYEEAKTRCDEKGLKDYTVKIEALDNCQIDVKASFEKAFYSLWLTKVLERYPAVQRFRKSFHENKLDSFVDLDRKQFVFSTNRIRRKLIADIPQVNEGIMRPELAILQRELTKKIKIKPLRRLFREMPHLLLTLKPCLMMSPLSVAYFLNADDYQFDVVIFDEASQIFPQDAIGSIFRAKQVIIAGDTKQLPPTNFFSSTSGIASDEYDTDDEYEEEVYDSILEETSTVLPSKMLLWHYRSKHEHLIAFSNQELYDNRLVTFPNKSMREPDTGVEYIYVEDGYYEKAPRNCNIEEAKKCVELVKTHIEKYPNRSLGIIAFSEKQQQAIILEIQRMRENNPKYEPFFEEGKEDEFFVKNLENVQGDERDTIIFSIGYAKTKEQKSQNKGMSMNFGPLTKQGGERRLNVAITRAKLNVKLVGSILPSDIDLERTESEGVRMLRSYVEFARNGEVSLASANKKKIQDDFVDTIYDFLQEKGYRVKKHVGCSGYKIDIVIENPNYEGEYAAGIECDGVVYASAHTARDRDRLRQSVLSNMGWKLYRVWSAEWMTNPALEAQSLITFVEDAIQESNRRVRRIEEERHRAENERRRAEEQRKQEEERQKREREQEEARKKWEREQKEYERKLQAQKQKEYERREINARKQVKLPVKEAKRDRTSSLSASQLSLLQDDVVVKNKQTSLRERLHGDELSSRREDTSESDAILNAFHVGDKVTHSIYGKGVVIAVSTSIKVRFDSGDEKAFGPLAVKNGYLKR